MDIREKAEMATLKLKLASAEMTNALDGFSSEILRNIATGGREEVVSYVEDFVRRASSFTASVKSLTEQVRSENDTRL